MSHLTLFCLLINDAHESVGDVFTVQVSPSDIIVQIKDVICQVGPAEVRKCLAADLFLWQPKNDFELGRSPYPGLQQLRLDRTTRKEANDKVTFIETMDEVLDVFNEELARRVHVLVQLPAGVDQGLRLRPLSTIAPLNDEAIIQKHIEAAKGKKPPSEGATHSAYPTTQADNPILNGRPFTTRATPVHLYHSVFTTFTNIYNDKAMKIPVDIQKHIYNLCHVSSQLYETSSRPKQRTGQNKRTKAIRPMYRLMLNESIGLTFSEESEPNGTITTMMGDGQMALRGIFEDKNEVGTATSDPSLQGCLSYRKFWSADELVTTRNKCCCPSFVIAAPGPWIAIHGAVLCDEGWIVQPLTDMVNLQYDPYDSPRMLNIGRLFLALRESLKELDIFYKEIENKATSVLWPSIRTYQDTQFEYLERLLPKYLSKAVFKGSTLPNNEFIVIKFTNSYCIDAHRLLQTQGLAPRLRYFSGDDKTFKKPGGLEMVIMDFVEDDSESPLTSKGREDVRRAIEQLHAAGYVFGDIRDANILKLPNGHAMLVDFDWSGREGQVFYPMGLNMQIKWPPGSGASMPIQKAHDLFMFGQL